MKNEDTLLTSRRSDRLDSLMATPTIMDPTYTGGARLSFLLDRAAILRIRTRRLHGLGDGSLSCFRFIPVLYA